MGTAGSFQLFGPPGKKDPGLKDLLFKDSAIQLKRIPPLMDSQLYLGLEYYSAIQSLQKGRQGMKYYSCVNCIEEMSSVNVSGERNTIFFQTQTVSPAKCCP